jgi:acetyl esterase/lipase
VRWTCVVRAVCAVCAVCAACVALVAGCTSVLFLAANAPAHFASVGRRTDVPYGQDPRQRLDVYTPRAGHALPIVVFWYGGAWSSGHKSQYRFVGAALAERGCIAVLPDYRLYPQVRFPAFIEDGARAVAWVERHAQELGGDPQRIVLMGHSAGAHLAATLALEPRYLEAAGVDRRAIAALIGLSGPYALEPDTDELRTIFSAPYTAEDWQPVRHASSQAPPALLIHGMDDRRVYARQATELRDALVSHGVRVELELYPGRGHADTVASFARLARGRTPALEQTLRFIASLAPQSQAARSNR